MKASWEERGRNTPATGNSACARVAEPNARRLGSVQQITRRRQERKKQGSSLEILAGQRMMRSRFFVAFFLTVVI